MDMKLLLMAVALIGLSACSANQIGTTTGGATGAAVGYAVSQNAWGAAIGGGAGALIGHQITRND